MKVQFLALLLLAFTAVSSPSQSTGAGSPHSRSAWSKALAASDLKSFSELLYAAQKASFPSTANEIAIGVALRANDLPASEREAARVAEFRIEAAHYLSLASRSGVIDVDKSALRTLAKEFVGKGRLLESKALSTLAHLQDRRDIPILVSVAESEDPNRYRTAVHSLRVMCFEETQKALDQVSRNSVSQEKQQFILDSRKLLTICRKAP